MIFLSSDNKIAYYHAPKCGSRTVLGYLSLVKEPEFFAKYPQYFHPTDDEVYSQLREKSQRLGKHHYEDFNVPVVDNEYRIVIKRDPVKRFISGYTNRVLHHKKLTTIPSIDEFIENFDRYEKKFSDIETHFRPQTQFFGKSRDNYTHIFDVTEMGKVKELFESVYNREFPELRLQQGGNKNKVELTDEQKSWVREKYKVDYDSGWC